MKISNELKVGLLALSATALLIWGYSYLKGKSLFSDNMIVYAIYDNVDGLTKSSTVTISGLKVGLVSNIKLLPDFSGRVLVTMEVEKELQIPRANTVPELADLSLLGGKTVKLDFKGSCNGPDCIQNGDTLYGRSLGMMDNIKKEINPYLEEAKNGYAKLDSLFQSYTSGNGDGGLGLSKTLKDFQSTIANLNGTTYKLNRLIGQSSGDIEATLANLNAISANLKASEADINRVIGNVGKFSERLEGIELEETVDSTQMTFASINKTLRTLDGTIADVQTLIKSVSTGSGTLSKLINEDQLYKDVDEAIKSINQLTDDIRLNPKRYINLRRKNQPYEPMVDPADGQ